VSKGVYAPPQVVVVDGEEITLTAEDKEEALHQTWKEKVEEAKLMQKIRESNEHATEQLELLIEYERQLMGHMRELYEALKQLMHARQMYIIERDSGEGDATEAAAALRTAIRNKVNDPVDGMTKLTIAQLKNKLAQQEREHALLLDNETANSTSRVQEELERLRRLTTVPGKPVKVPEQSSWHHTTYSITDGTAMPNDLAAVDEAQRKVEEQERNLGKEMEARLNGTK
jgi:hypothetical protein